MAIVFITSNHLLTAQGQHLYSWPMVNIKWPHFHILQNQFPIQLNFPSTTLEQQQPVITFLYFTSLVLSTHPRGHTVTEYQ